MASIRPRKNSDGSVSWRVQFRIDGKGAQETFQDDQSAREFGALVDRVGGTAARRVLDARNENVGVPTMREWTEKYLDADSGLLTGITAGTRNGYRKSAELSFLPFMGDYPLTAIDKPLVGRWISWQEAQPSRRSGASGEPVAAKTVKNYHTLLSSVLAAAVDEKHIAANPAYRARMTQGAKREGVFLSPVEFNTLLHFIPAKHKAFVLFLAGTGTRWGEATAVTWGDLNLHGTPPTVRINKAWKRGETGSPVLGTTKTSRGRRTIGLWPSLVTALGEPGDADALMFSNEDGGHMWHGHFTNRVWKKAVTAAQDAEQCAAAGLPRLTQSPRIHDMRHSHASWLIASGTPLPYIQARLGHESITTTANVYGHLVPDAHAQMAYSVAQTMAGVTFPEIGS